MIHFFLFASCIPRSSLPIKWTHIIFIKLIERKKKKNINLLLKVEMNYELS